MSVTVSNVLAGGAAPTAGVNTTASWTPDGTSQYILNISSYVSSGSVTPAITSITGNGLTWASLIAVVHGDNTGADLSSQYMYAVPAGGSSGAITINWASAVPTKVSWSLDKVAGGASGLGTGSLPQAAVSGTSSGANPSATLGSALAGGSVSYAAADFESSSGVLSAGSGYTALGTDTSQSLAWIISEWNSAGSTTASATNSVVANRHSIILIEIAVAAGGGTVNGDAALTETATVTTGAAVSQAAASALSSTATVATAATVVEQAAAALTVTAARATVATVAQAAASAITETVTASTTATVAQAAAAALPVTASVATVAAAARAAAAALSTTVTITTAATVTTPGVDAPVSVTATVTTGALVAAMGTGNVQIQAQVVTAATMAMNAQAAAVWAAAISTAATVDSPTDHIPLGVVLDTILNELVTHAKHTGLFRGGVNTVEPKQAPQSPGMSAAIWSQSIAPVGALSGLSRTTARIEYMNRLYQNMTSTPQDSIDPRMLNAVALLMEAYSGDFQLGGTAMAIDLLGMAGQPLRAEAGYIPQDGRLFRCYTIFIPVLVADVFEQVA